MKRSFSLVEIITVVFILLIVVTFGIAGYRQLVDNARQRVCETNLKALEAAVEIYALENDIVPATLGDLKLEHLKKGYAKALQEGGWFTKFAYFIVKLNTPSEVYAQFLTPENLKKYGVVEEIFHCPADKNGAPSYGINANIAGKKWSEVGEDTIIVAECDDYTFDSLDDLAPRHIRKMGLGGKVAIFIRKNKSIDKKSMGKKKRDEKPGDNPPSYFPFQGAGGK